MFDVGCAFRNTPASSHSDESMSIAEISCAQISESYAPILALDNWPNAELLYGYQLPNPLPNQMHAALIAGNERHGISREVTSIATKAIAIPMISKQLNCINVAAASAVALYYLTHAHKGRMQVRNDPQQKRPEIILIAGSNHAELGSVIRSAAAFGWNRTFIEDRRGVWFGCDRVTRSEGRAAARRGRNTIRLIPSQSDNQYLFREAVVITTRDVEGSVPLPRIDLSKGPNQAVIVADESEIEVDGQNWSRVAESVRFAKIELPSNEFTYHFRHPASIAMAEISRQVGQRALWKPTRQKPLYESALKLLSQEKGEEIDLDDLSDY
jgi:tRNA(Leu) C34 or U34 (ribose-2'-O)-methylase TrmL